MPCFSTPILDVKFSVFEAVRGSPYCLAYGFFSGPKPVPDLLTDARDLVIHYLC